jgi:hypothetical protein
MIRPSVSSGAFISGREPIGAVPLLNLSVAVVVEFQNGSRLQTLVRRGPSAGTKLGSSRRVQDVLSHFQALHNVQPEKWVLAWVSRLSRSTIRPRCSTAAA